LQKQSGGSKCFPSTSMFEAASKPLFQLQHLKQFDKDDQASKGRESLIFKSELWNLGDFPGNVFSATLHLYDLFVFVCLVENSHKI
jgi:hypothetical protein